MSTVPERRPMVAGNWKMNVLPSQAAALTTQLIEASTPRTLSKVEVVLCPPAAALAGVSQAAAGYCGVGAQTMHWEPSGAYTGELSAPMIADLCRYVILGHSERRHYFGESDDGVRRKVGTALQYGLTPIVCVGETEAQRSAGLTHDFISLQVRAALHDRSEYELARIVVAYEPIWAIGTGVAASASDAQEVAYLIRSVLNQLGGSAADAVRILYGGSVTGANSGEFTSQADIDGALVGGASLKPADFARILESASAITR